MYLKRRVRRFRAEGDIMGTVAGAGHPMDPASISWHDTKRYAWLLGLAIPMLPFVAAGLVKATGITVFWWLGPLFVFGIVPVLDTLVGKDSENPPDSMIASLEGDRYYRWCLYLFLPLQFAALVGACFEWSSGSLSVVDCLGLAATMGVVGGAGICTAHELGHKSEKVERWLSKITLAQTGYGHFFVEHNRGHHVRVATPEDPASSRLGESFWAFLPRTVRGSLVSAWEIEKLRLRRNGKPAFSLENDAVNAWVMTVALYGILLGVFGRSILPWLMIQAVLGFSLLETISSTTVWRAGNFQTGASSRALSGTRGTPIRSFRTCCCTICSATRTTMRTHRDATSHCAATRRLRNCPRVTERWQSSP